MTWAGCRVVRAPARGPLTPSTCVVIVSGMVNVCRGWTGDGARGKDEPDGFQRQSPAPQAGPALSAEAAGRRLGAHPVQTHATFVLPYSEERDRHGSK